MGAEKISFEQIQQLDLPPIIVYAIPIMLFFVLLEFIVSNYQKRKVYEGKDFLACVGLGVGNIISSALVKTGLFALVLVFYNIVPWRIPHTWYSYVLCFISIDFARYWAHRCAHEQRWLWSTHVPHHSSEHMHFAISFRLSWIQHVKIIFFLPVAMMGFDPFVFFITHQMAVLFQFWIHTEIINKLPKPVEFLLVTPSSHRVHHGTNPQYIDKNFGSTLIIWDRIFGTFEPEGEPVKYGITTPVNSYNPVWLNFHEVWAIIQDLRKAKGFKDVKQILIGYPGSWQPAMNKKKSANVKANDSEVNQSKKSHAPLKIAETDQVR